MVERAGINEAMCSKDTISGESIGDEERDWRRGKERIEVIEDTELDTGIVSDLREGEEEIEIIIESIKIGEGRVDEVESGEKMKGRDAERTGEDSRRDIAESSAWPWLSSSILNISSLLAFDFSLFFLFLDF